MGTYVLQMGHVPRTRGATGAPGEQGYNQAVCNEAAAILRGQGHTVHVIPADPHSYPAGDVFVAVHYDGSNSPSAKGASVGYRNSAGQVWAHRWKVAYQRAGFSGGFRPDNYTAGLRGYYGTGRSRCRASFILEGGFGSHPQEGPWLRSPAGISTCARAIAMALTGDAGSVPPAPPPEEDEVKQEDIDAIAQKAADLTFGLIKRYGLTGRTKDDIAKRVWLADVHGKPARNRLHDADVKASQIRKEVAEHAEDVTPPDPPEESAVEPDGEVLD